MPQSTHDLLVDGDVVVKRFTSWQRGEPEREWRGLELVRRHAPGLAPTPLSRRRDGGSPGVVMSRVAGVAVGERRVTDRQVAAIAAAMTRLHHAVPQQELAGLPPRLSGPHQAIVDLRAWQPGRPDTVTPEVGHALDAAAAWLASPSAEQVAGGEAVAVFSHGDGNLGNYVWDGARCTIVDFEDSGVSDRAFEVADLVEHLSSWLSGHLEAERFLAVVELDEVTRERLAHCRVAMATFWLYMLLPGGRAHHRNPAGSLERQAGRLLGLLDQVR